MTTTTKILLGMAAAVIIVGLSVFGYYNRLVSRAEAVDGQWAQVETQYQRRLDLIPNLVESTKGIFNQEKEVFGKLAEARSRYAGATTINDKAGAATQLESSLARLLVVIENYPQLKSAENVQTLMTQLEGTENRVSVERKRFNDMVQNYNVTIKRFPGNVLAGWFGFAERAYFNAVTGAEIAPQVKF